MQKPEPSISLSFLDYSLFVPSLQDSVDCVFKVHEVMERASFAESVDGAGDLASLVLGEEQYLVGAFYELLLTWP